MRTSRKQYALRVLVILFGLAFSLFPILWALSTSLKSSSEAVAFPPTIIPHHVTFVHYVKVFAESEFARYLLNSAVVALSASICAVVIGVHAGYAAARYPFPAKRVLLFVILSTVMIPLVVVMVPVYILASKLGLVDTYAALIIVYTGWQLPPVVWFMRGFFEKIPKELGEAALVDGCGHLNALYRVILPTCLPGIAASMIIVFIWVWNEFIIALTLTTSDSMRLAPVGLYYYVGEYGIQWGALTAASIITIGPVIVFFSFLQRYLISGLTGGAVKG
jgi:multiple sugar transport system permease protein